MSRKKTFLLVLLVGIILLGSAASAQLEDSPSPAVRGHDWMFETNNAWVSPSPSYHRLVLVASDCDVNGDGYEDVLVSKRDFDNPGYMDSGKAWLFYGGPNGLPASPSRIFDPPYLNLNGFFGAAIACNGDVDGDGYDDILIGQDNYESNLSTLPDEGAVWLWLGDSAGPTAGYNWWARGNAYYGHFGFSLDFAGDVNNDSYDDIIVGSYRPDNNQVSHAYVWLGSASGLGANGLPSNADWYASDPHPGVVAGNAFAYTVRGIGNVNGDQYDDVLVSAPSYDNGITDQGAVFVYYGSGTFDADPNGTIANADWMAASGQDSARFAWAADGVGDVNNDTYDDLAVGAYYYDDPEASEGAVFVWLGSGTGLGANGSPANADWMAESNFASGTFGYVVRGAGDVNNDDYDDILTTSYNFSAPGYPAPLAQAGGWFVWHGGPGGPGETGTPDNADLAGYGIQAVGLLGREDVAAGDVNDDGLDDIFAASLLYDNGQEDEGAVFGYYSAFELFLPLAVK